MNFLSERATLSGTTNKMNTLQVEKIVRVGADVLGVGMSLSQAVKIQVPVSGNKQYTVYTSEDGFSWSPQENGNSLTSQGGKLSFQTNHFSYFALVDLTQSTGSDTGGGGTGGTSGGTTTLSNGNSNAGAPLVG